VILPEVPAKPFDKTIRNLSDKNLLFSVPLNYGSKQTQTLSHGTYNVFWEEEQKKYFVIHNQ
jgi:hypothetical protein